MLRSMPTGGGGSSPSPPIPSRPALPTPHLPRLAGHGINGPCARRVTIARADATLSLEALVSRTGLDDARAVGRVLAGGTEAFGSLVHAHQEYLFRLLSRHLPVDEVAGAAQDAFVDAFTGLSKLREPGSFRSWLSAIALRRAADFWRQKARRGEHPVDFTSPEELAWLEGVMAQDSMERFEAEEDRREAHKLAQRLLETLPPEDRIAVELYYGQEHSITEIAELLGWGEPKVKVRLHRARKKMAERCARILGREMPAAEDVL